MIARSTDLVFLLGAGCSVEAGIPASAAMIKRIEDNLRDDVGWRRFERLYYHVKSAIEFARNIKGPHAVAASYNIETLANTLFQLEQNEDHPLYPFIAAWNSRFITLASDTNDGVGSFSRVAAFRRMILDALKKWVGPETLSKADYYSGFTKIQRAFTFPLDVFSLNYDLCFERLASTTSAKIETGFEGFGSLWDWRRFRGERTSELPEPDFYLYKLHGSLDWVRDPTNGSLFKAENPGAITSERLEVIFGRDFKLEASDPYLFYAYQFRIRTLEARLLVAIGYGFDDVHINKMMSQAMLHDGKKVLLSISDCLNAEDKERHAGKIARSLALPDVSRIHVFDGTAKSALQMDDVGAKVLQYLPKEANAPF